MLDESFNLILEKGLKEVYQRYKNVAELSREMGLELYPKKEELCSPNVTAFRVKDEARKIQKELKEKHDILTATSLRELKDDIIRVGHMSYNADEEKVKKQ